tara:strand:- start:1869 stop:5318 length:3450 start_codon:yes stop_codon:yes gene_type:complete
MGKSAPAPTRQVTEYFCSVHYGICQGRVDSLNYVKINDKIAWKGTVAYPALFSISELELFGGLEKEGGVSGHVFWQNGSFGQYASNTLASKFDRTPANMPAFRGVATAFFTGPGSVVNVEADRSAPVGAVEAQAPESPEYLRPFSNYASLIEGNKPRPFASGLTTEPGFYWSANQPFIWPCHFNVTRIPKGLNVPTATIYRVPEGKLALCFTIDDTGSMSGARGTTMKAAMSGVLDILKRSIEDGGMELDLYIGKWGQSNVSHVEFVDCTPADIETARDFVNGFVYNSGSTYFNYAVEQALDFFSGTVTVTPPPEPDTVQITGFYNAATGGEGGSNASISFNAPTFGGTPIPNVQAGDSVPITYSNGTQVTAQISGVIRSPEDGTATWILANNITAPPIDGTTGGEGGTGYSHLNVANAAQGPTKVESTRGVVDRVWVFLTDGQAQGGSENDAAEDAADLLDQETGVYAAKSEENEDEAAFLPDFFNNLGSGNPNDKHLRLDRTTVDVYGINLVEENTEDTALLDNTPGDGVPVIPQDDPDALMFALLRAIFRDKLPDSCPAHMIYECLTDTAWGMGAPASAIESSTFLSASETLYQEGFGLSMIWTQQQEIEKFIREVLDHIEATLFVNPRTGKFELKLIRDDYDPETLDLFDDNNMTVKQFARRTPSEIINEINLTWTNPETEEEETITGQDLGAIVANNGDIQSDNRNYYGIRDLDLANDVLARDLAAATAPLSTAEISVNREAWTLFPGSVIKFYAPEYDDNVLVMRVGKINYGRPGDSEIVVSLTQDIFSFTKPTLERPPGAITIEPPPPPSRFAYVAFQSFNYFFARAFNVAISDESEAATMILASTTNRGATEAEVIGEVVDNAGNTTTEKLSSVSIVARGELPADFEAEDYTTTTGFNSLSKGIGPSVGGFALIGHEGDPEELGELILFTAFDGTNWTVKRGVLDTIPQKWITGTPLRFFSSADRLSDRVVRAAEVEVDYKLLMRTPVGLFDEASARFRTFTPSERAFMPTRPADVRIDGTAFSKVELMGGKGTVTWANRNRLTEDSQPLAWTDAGIAPEEGQTTTIRILDKTTRAVLSEHTGIEGESFDLEYPFFDGTEEVIVQVTAARDGLESLRPYEQAAKIVMGYGLGYGYAYGGME